MSKIDPDFVMALGKLTGNFSTLEFHICAVAWSLMNDDLAVGQLVTSQLSFERLLTVLDGLMRIRCGDKHPELVDRVEALIKKAKQCEEERNKIVHSFWGESDSDGAFVMYRMKFVTKRGKGVEFQTELTDADSILEVSRKMQECGKGFLSLLNECGELGVFQMRTLPS